MLIPCQAKIFNTLRMIYKTKYDGYFVDEEGNVYSNFKKGGQGSKQSTLRKLKPKIDKDGYLEYGISINGKTKYRRGHRIVYEAIKGDIDKKLTIDHINKNTMDNNINNLRLLTRADNTRLATSRAVTIILDDEVKVFKSNKEAYEWLGIKGRSYFNYKKGKSKCIKKFIGRNLKILEGVTTTETVPIM
ncbi:MAG: HNH endonuclease signature motif containing protein [Cetobacterium sp.]